ncbi:MAG: radical SAM protein [Candidatus Alcyoniella australis]|nr:radical SAM protein [Candidatus Alcyoniella australis]
MKVSLLRPFPKNSVCSSVPPLGMGYIATALLRAEIEVELLDLGNKYLQSKDFEARLEQSRPDLVGIQVYSREMEQNQQMIDRARNVLGHDVPIVAGGPHPSTMPLETFEHLRGIDYVIAGEGERAMPLLARHVAGDGAVDLADVPGLVWRENGGFRQNTPDFPENIDAYGFPAWDVMRIDGYQTEVFGGGFTQRMPAMTMLTSRGCPYKCTFCCAKSLCGSKLRLRDPKLVLEEMTILHQRYGINEIKIIDDNVNADRQHILAIAEEFKRSALDVSVSFACGLHLHTLDDEMLDALKQMGGYELMVAIESGSQRVLDMMKKKVRLDQVPQKIEMIKRHGFRAISFFIIGFPGETRQEIEQTVKLALSLPLDRAHFNCFSPLPGSQIYDDLKAAGRLGEFDIRNIHFETINYSFVEGLSAQQLDRIRQRALLRFYLRPRTFFGLWRTFRNWSSVKFLLRKAMEYFRIVK